MAALKSKNRKSAISGALALAKEVGQFPSSKLWLDYDSEADVLYISLNRPQKATQTVEDDENGVVLHYRDKKLVGITVLDASQRAE